MNASVIVVIDVKLPPMSDASAWIREDHEFVPDE